MGEKLQQLFENVAHDPRIVTNVCVLEHGAQKFVGKSAAAIEEYHKLLE